MIRAANKTLDVPSYQTLMSFLQTTKLSAMKKMKAFLKGKHFSITMDHWTSLATDNYGAITLHVIDDFKLITFVLSCVKHDNGCTASEMEHQLLLDMEQWGLDKKFVSCITDSASNMNSFGEKIDKWIDAPILRHYYCADHIFQLTAVYAYSGNIPAVLRPDEDQSVTVVIASEKIKRAQLEVNPTCTALKLVSDCETRKMLVEYVAQHST
jgi:hypothetical protein